MESILIAARDRRFVAIESVVPRPDPLTPAEAARLARTATGSSQRIPAGLK
jgi:hypothetical protein